MNEKKSLLIVGSMAYDDLELPSGTFENVVGGAANYAALSASMFTHVQMVGVVGNDFDTNFLHLLEERQIDIKGVQTIKNGKTFRWRGRYASDLRTRETLNTELNVFANFTPEIPASYKKSAYVLLGNIHPSLQLDVLSQLSDSNHKGHGDPHVGPKLVALDTMNFWISKELNLLKEVLKKIDLLVINDEEARELSGLSSHSSLKQAASRIEQMGPKKIIIKKGEHGAMLFDSLGPFFVPAFLLEQVIDPTGAGDSFAGGLMGYLAACDDSSARSALSIRKAMIFASIMGSICIEDVGTKQLQKVTKKDIEQRVGEFVSFTNYGEDLTMPK